VLSEGLTANNVTDVDPYEFIYQNLPQRHILSKVPDYNYCGVTRFQYETPGFCCRKEKSTNTYTRGSYRAENVIHEDAKYFRKRIRYLNLHFAFASLGVILNCRYNSRRETGIYTFRVHGGLYHRLDHLVPGGHGARRLQLYFYDT
jgi:hypothetical protein